MSPRFSTLLSEHESPCESIKGPPKIVLEPKHEKRDSGIAGIEEHSHSDTIKILTTDSKKDLLCHSDTESSLGTDPGKEGEGGETEGETTEDEGEAEGMVTRIDEVCVCVSIYMYMHVSLSTVHVSHTHVHVITHKCMLIHTHCPPIKYINSASLSLILSSALRGRRRTNRALQEAQRHQTSAKNHLTNSTHASFLASKGLQHILTSYHSSVIRTSLLSFAEFGSCWSSCKEKDG